MKKKKDRKNLKVEMRRLPHDDDYCCCHLGIEFRIVGREFKGKDRVSEDSFQVDSDDDDGFPLPQKTNNGNPFLSLKSLTLCVSCCFFSVPLFLRCSERSLTQRARTMARKLTTVKTLTLSLSLSLSIYIFILSKYPH